jgi:hypothetical protein
MVINRANQSVEELFHPSASVGYERFFLGHVFFGFLNHFGGADKQAHSLMNGFGFNIEDSLEAVGSLGTCLLGNKG